MKDSPLNQKNSGRVKVRCSSYGVLLYLISNRECDSTEENLENVESGRSFINRRKGGKMTEKFRQNFWVYGKTKRQRSNGSLAKIKKSSRIQHKF